jgi:flagellar hook assembly protein FlgD
VSAAVYDIRGRLVRVLVDRPIGAGRHTVHWDGKDEHGDRVASGVYFVRLDVGSESEVRKLTILR